MKKIKIVLFTNNIRGIFCLKYLNKKKINIDNIVISKKYLDLKVINYLKEKKKNFLLIKNLNNKKLLKILSQSELGLICGFPHIFKKQHFNSLSYGMINLHAGILPKYRGGSPLSWQILNNEKKFGITSIKINNGIDTGEIISQKKFKLLKKFRINDLKRITNNHFPLLLYKSIQKIILKKKLKKQNIKNASYFRQRNRKDSLIDPNKMTLKKLLLLFRATYKTYQHPYIILGSKKIVIERIKISKANIDFKKKNIIIFKNKYYIKLKDKKVVLIS